MQQDTRPLLIDTMPFIGKIMQPQDALIESTVTAINNKLFVEGPIHKADVINNNLRIYPKRVLTEKVDKYIDLYVKQHRAYGELDHPDSNQVSLQKASHTIEKLYWDGNTLIGVIEIINGTIMGDIVKAILLAGKTIGISSRGLGSVKKIENNIVEVQDDYDIICWDFVSDPSTPGAFLRAQINESKQLNLNNTLKKYYYVNLIANDIMRNNNNLK